MMKDHRTPPPIVNLKYKKGELVIKEGDYGISVYKIVKGAVQTFTHSGDKEVPLALLAPGEVIGEMAFLSKHAEPRSASARAIQDSELEVWHSDLLSKEYKYFVRRIFSFRQPSSRTVLGSSSAPAL